MSVSITIDQNAKPRKDAAEVLKKANQLIAAGRIIAQQTCPYFRPIIMAFVMREVWGLGTVGVTERAIFIYDPDFVVRQTPRKMAGLVIHEVQHLWNKHGKRLNGRDPGEWNRAGDRAINPPILQMGLELPDGDDGGVWPKDLGMPDGLTADEYYRAAMKQQKQKGGAKGKGQPGAGGKRPGQSDGDADGEGGEPGKGKGSVCHGACGGCASNPGKDEPGADDPDGRSDAQVERVVRAASEAVRAAASGPGRGKIPEAWARMAEANLEPPKVPWRQRLSNACRTAVSFRPGAFTHRYDGPSRRQAGIGFGGGHPILARLRQPVPNVAVMVDTSGSMGPEALQDALNETQGVMKAIGADIACVTADAAVHGEKAKVRSIHEVARMLKGGGGTDFRPGFAALSAMKPRPEVVVFVTDADGPWPDQCPRGMRVIVLLVGRYMRRECVPSWVHETIVYENEGADREAS